MEQAVEKINVRGAIRALRVKGKPLKLARWDGKEGYKPTVIRATAAIVTGDTNRKFTVSVGKDQITITRNS